MQLITPKKEHLQQVMTWFPDQASFDLWAGHNFRYPYTELSFTEDLKMDRLITRVLVDGEEPVALGQVYNRVGRCQLGRLVTNPELRGQGIGSILIQKLMVLGDEELPTKDYSLFVFATNTRAKKLYERLGFKVTEYPEAMPMDNCYYMVKTDD